MFTWLKKLFGSDVPDTPVIVQEQAKAVATPKTQAKKPATRKTTAKPKAPAKKSAETTAPKKRGRPKKTQS